MHMAALRELTFIGLVLQFYKLCALTFPHCTLCSPALKQCLVCNPPFAVNADGYCGEPHFLSLQSTQEFFCDHQCKFGGQQRCFPGSCPHPGHVSLAMPRMAAKESCNLQNPHCSWLALLALPVLILL